jgi:flavodoxin
MNALVVFDSAYGNTGKIAHAIGEGICQFTPSQVRHVEQVSADNLNAVDLLVVGSPTQRFSPTPAITTFLKSLPNGSLNDVRVAAFDTRFTVAKIAEIRVLEFFVNIFGYAAVPIAKQLTRKGGLLTTEPEGFYVADTEGPLLENELERARDWGQALG